MTPILIALTAPIALALRLLSTVSRAGEVAA